jgi:hypothetical protein
LLIAGSVIYGSTLGRLYTHTKFEASTEKYMNSAPRILHTDQIKTVTSTTSPLNPRQFATFTYARAIRRDTHVTTQSESDVISRPMFPRINIALLIDTSNPWSKRPAMTKRAVFSDGAVMIASRSGKFDDFNV